LQVRELLCGPESDSGSVQHTHRGAGPAGPAQHQLAPDHLPGLPGPAHYGVGVCVCQPAPLQVLHTHAVRQELQAASECAHLVVVWPIDLELTGAAVLLPSDISHGALGLLGRGFGGQVHPGQGHQ